MYQAGKAHNEISRRYNIILFSKRLRDANMLDNTQY